MSNPSQRVHATLTDLQRTVLHDDNCPGRVVPADINTVVEMTVKRLGFTARGRCLTLDIGNGHMLVCTVEKINATVRGEVTL
ncbi:MAG: hypothetical protein K2W93_08910 [Burkholderiaceae bacterium]|nr:hypothetical protein [Burkholderiaceae bacterium]